MIIEDASVTYGHRADISFMIGAIILAAGDSRRFGSDKRKSRLADGTLLVARSIHNALATFDAVLVVLRCDDQAFSKELEATFANPVFRTFCAPRSSLGMGHSLANAIGQVDNWDGAFVFLADMPFVRLSTPRLLKATLESHPASIVVPVHGGNHGHPVGFSRCFFDEIEQLGGDKGAKPVMARHPEAVFEIHVDDRGVLEDIDTPEDLRRHRKGTESERAGRTP